MVSGLSERLLQFLFWDLRGEVEKLADMEDLRMHSKVSGYLGCSKIITLVISVRLDYELYLLYSVMYKRLTIRGIMWKVFAISNS